MLILEAAVYCAVALYAIVLTQLYILKYNYYTTIILTTLFQSMRLGQITETPLCLIHYSLTAPQTTSSKMITQLNHHLSETVSTSTEHYNNNEGGFIVKLFACGFR